MALTEADWKIIMIVTQVNASLSLICAIITIVTFFIWKRFRTAVSGPVCLMAAADILSMIGYSISRYGPRAGQHTVLCQIQGTLIQVGDLSAILWPGCIAMDLMLVMYKGRSISQVDQLHYRVYAPICVAIPIIVGLSGLLVRDGDGNRFYGDSGPWCWISKPYLLFQLLLLYIPLWIVFLFNLGIYSSVGRLIWNHSKLSGRQLANREANKYKYTYIKNVSLYLLAFLATWAIPSVNRFYNYFHPDKPLFILHLLHALLLTSNGVLNCAVYFYVAWISRVMPSARSRSNRSRPESEMPTLPPTNSVAKRNKYGGNDDFDRDILSSFAPEESSYLRVTLEHSDYPPAPTTTLVQTRTNNMRFPVIGQALESCADQSPDYYQSNQAVNKK
ncbi:hypothetical protein BDF22DRAFT_668361 [Syncephalis plumigaleata]|nr:hypothetical protein BDF22DRAFT_668361 [Syncephalis plumigaleata]